MRPSVVSGRAALCLVAVLCLSECAVLEEEDDFVKLKINQGIIDGSKEEMSPGRFLYGFKGIPFAKPPVGDLRFLAPQKADPWEGVRNGAVDPPRCPQPEFNAFIQGRFEIIGEEDCLYLNVFTPNLTGPVPVMVWIHGGGFMMGGAKSYSPYPLVTEDVVLVVLQYRLGALGFLSTDDQFLAGNLGLRDQAEALEWVKSNIEEFGGDSEKITVFGQGSGAASTHLHVLADRNLLTQAILQSGNAFCPGVMRNDHRRIAFAAGKMLGCENIGDTLRDMKSSKFLTCVREASVTSLAALPFKFFEFMQSPIVFTPRDSHERDVTEGYLDRTIAYYARYDYYTPGIRLIIGHTQDEGAFAAAGILSNKTAMNMLRENFDKVGHLPLSLMPSDEDPSYLARRVFYRYLGGLNISETQLQDLSQMLGNRMIKVCSAEAAAVHARERYRYIYLYELQHKGSASNVQLYNISTENGETGAAHGDDLQYLFSPSEPLTRDSDLLVSKIMVKLWTSFAKTGNPTRFQTLGFRWRKAYRDNYHFLSLKPDAEMMEDKQKEMREFFKALPTAYNKYRDTGSFGYSYG